MTFRNRVLIAFGLQILAVQCVTPSALRAASAVPVNPVRPLQTELMTPFDLSRVHAGSPVLVRVDLGWDGSGCTLRAGSILRGRVVEVTKRSGGVRDSAVTLTFDAADCENHQEESFHFKLVALVGGLNPTSQSGVSEAPPLADAIANPIGGPGGIRSAGAASSINSALSLPVQQLPSRILPGEVIGVKKTILVLDAGEQGATTVKAIGHDLRLEQGTCLILTHEAGTPAASKKFPPARPVGFSMSGTGGGGSEMIPTESSRVEKTVVPASSAAAADVRVSEPPDETNICTGSCTLVDAGDDQAEDSAATASLSLKGLKYAPRNNREVQAFDHETTLTYLDAHTVLCTFDSHQLRERTGLGQENARKIRAVLADAETHSIERVLEWRVQGDEEYLWRLANGKILVHMGRNLRELDDQLRPVRSIPIDGKVAWVVPSPTGDHIAVGIVRERHSEAMHRELEAALPDSPEENIEVRVYDKDRAVILTTVQSSKAPQPVLSDTGELRLHGDGHTHWKLSEYRWDRTEHAIATTISACRPVLSAPGHDLIFAVGCTTSGGRWYRMLRSDGHPVLKGESASDEIQHYAQGTGGGSFAIRTVKAVHAMSYGQPFKRSDLTQERLAIYRSEDGTHLASIATADFAMSQLAFALSPNGDQMAVIGDHAILFYPVHLHGR